MKKALMTFVVLTTLVCMVNSESKLLCSLGNYSDVTVTDTPVPELSLESDLIQDRYSNLAVDLVFEKLSWYTEIEPLTVKTTDKDNPVQVSITVVIGYAENDKETLLEITQKKNLIVDFLRNYFRGKLYDQLLAENEDTLRMEIRNGINDDILARTKIKDVRFMDLTIILQ